MKYLSKIDDEKVINETVFTKIDNSILINPNTLYLRLHNDICMECFEASINELIQIAKKNILFQAMWKPSQTKIRYDGHIKHVQTVEYIMQFVCTEEMGNPVINGATEPENVSV